MYWFQFDLKFGWVGKFNYFAPIFFFKPTHTRKNGMDFPYSLVLWLLSIGNLLEVGFVSHGTADICIGNSTFYWIPILSWRMFSTVPEGTNLIIYHLQHIPPYLKWLFGEVLIISRPSSILFRLERNIQKFSLVCYHEFEGKFFALDSFSWVYISLFYMI